MKNLFLEIEELFKTIPEYCDDDNKLLKNKIIDAANNLDENVIQLLLENESAKNHFFKKIGDIVVFDKIKFQRFLNNKEFLPDSFTAFKNKIGLTVDNKYLNESNDVVLSWAYKDCILEGGQDDEDAKRGEIFYNETLAPDEIDALLKPKALVNFKKYDANGESVPDKVTKDDNLIIKGNNLLALHTLKKNYAGQVKLIYIDPPYNTGSDSFKYNDKFNHSTWLTFMKNRLEIAKELLRDDGVICVQCDDNENAYLKVLMDEIFETGFLNNIAVKMSEASGVKMSHAHTRFPKLKEYILIYKNMSFDGFYEIDKYEQKDWDAENNIFLEGFTKSDREKIIELEDKEENDIGDVKQINQILNRVKRVSLSKKIKENNFKSFSDETNWLFENSFRIIKTAGSSSLFSLVKAIDKIPNQEVACALSKSKEIFFYITDFNRNTKQPRLQVIFADSNIYKNPCDFWQDIKTTGAIADEGGVKLSNGKKPEKILHRLIKNITTKGDIVLDFHLGSGTTAAVSHKMGRKYIGVEQMDYGENDSVKRLINVIGGDQTGISGEIDWQGGGSFVYCELAKSNQEFVDKITNSKSKEDLVKIWQEMQEKAFLSYKFNKYDAEEKELAQFQSDLESLELDDLKRFLFAVLDKNMLYVPLSEIEDKTYKINKHDITLNKSFFGEA